MAWCETNGVHYVFGLSGTRPPSRKVDETADAVRTERALDDKDVVRGYAETRHKAKSWDRERRAIVRIEATRLGLDIRFVVTHLDHGSPEWLYDSLARADRPKTRSSCTRRNRLPIARPVVHRQSGSSRAAHRLMLAVRDAPIEVPSPLACGALEVAARQGAADLLESGDRLSDNLGSDASASGRQPRRARRSRRKAARHRRSAHTPKNPRRLPRGALPRRRRNCPCTPARNE